MFEKVNPMHPDKIADRIAGAIVDLAYKKSDTPKVAVEVLIGHGYCHIINETSERFTKDEIKAIVTRIAGEMTVDYKEYKQDKHLAQNQNDGVRCGDNGIFKGERLSKDEKELSKIARTIYWKYRSDGKYILDGDILTICQSNAPTEEIKELFPNAIINPLGDWTGGTDVDTGATNRKLGSDMGRSVTGGGLHGKDLSKADVSINIYCFLLAQDRKCSVKCSCSIGDETVWVMSGDVGYMEEVEYEYVVEKAREYINEVGGFEKFAEWGLI